MPTPVVPPRTARVERHTAETLRDLSLLALRDAVQQQQQSASVGGAVSARGFHEKGEKINSPRQSLPKVPHSHTSVMQAKLSPNSNKQQQRKDSSPKKLPFLHKGQDRFLSPSSDTDRDEFLPPEKRVKEVTTLLEGAHISSAMKSQLVGLNGLTFRTFDHSSGEVTVKSKAAVPKRSTLVRQRYYELWADPDKVEEAEQLVRKLASAKKSEYAVASVKRRHAEILSKILRKGVFSPEIAHCRINVSLRIALEELIGHLGMDTAELSHIRVHNAATDTVLYLEAERRADEELKRFVAKILPSSTTAVDLMEMAIDSYRQRHVPPPPRRLVDGEPPQPKPQRRPSFKAVAMVPGLSSFQPLVTARDPATPLSKGPVEGATQVERSASRHGFGLTHGSITPQPDGGAVDGGAGKLGHIGFAGRPTLPPVQRTPAVTTFVAAPVITAQLGSAPSSASISRRESSATGSGGDGSKGFGALQEAPTINFVAFR